jgi:hypothetical protein
VFFGSEISGQPTGWFIFFKATAFEPARKAVEPERKAGSLEECDFRDSIPPKKIRLQ